MAAVPESRTIGQWEFRIISGGEADSICFLSLSRICRASLTSRVGPVGSDQLDLGHGEAGTVNDLDERDGLPQGFGEDDPLECGEQRVLPGQLVPVRERDRHVDRLAVRTTIDMPFEDLEPVLTIQGVRPWHRGSVWHPPRLRAFNEGGSRRMMLASVALPSAARSPVP